MLSLSVRPWSFGALFYVLCLAVACDSGDSDTVDAGFVPESGTDASMDASMDASPSPVDGAAADRLDDLEDATLDDAQTSPDDAAQPDDASAPDANQLECDPGACADGGCPDPEDAGPMATRPDGCLSKQRCVEGRCVDVCERTSWENEYSSDPDPDPEDAYCLVFFYDCGPEQIDYWHSVTTTSNECGTRGGIDPFEGEGTCSDTTAGFFEDCGIELILE